METSTEDVTPIPGTSKELKLGNCEVCNVTAAKYTCPKCEVKTCCLKCSLIHKKELECDGNRNRTKYIPLKKFTNLDLSSDYRLLEEITRTLEKCRKGRRHFSRDSSQLPHHLFKLKKSSQDRKTVLKFLPQNFERRKKNTTRVNYHTDVIFWHVQWVFTNADDLKLADDRVRESEKLGKVLSKHLIPQENKVLQEKLQFYQAVGLTGIRLFLRAEGKSGRKFYELDSTLSLKENFSGKTIIEYPIIHVVFREHGDSMDVVDSDCEDDVREEKQKSGGEVIENIIKKSESDDTIYMHLKNLLFISEHSEGEMSS